MENGVGANPAGPQAPPRPAPARGSTNTRFDICLVNYVFEMKKSTLIKSYIFKKVTINYFYVLK